MYHYETHAFVPGALACIEAADLGFVLTREVRPLLPAQIASREVAEYLFFFSIYIVVSTVHGDEAAETETYISVKINNTANGTSTQIGERSKYNTSTATMIRYAHIYACIEQ